MELLNAALLPWLDRWPVRQRYLVGVSGGVDSVVLLRSLRAIGYRNLIVCHLDHGLRGHTSTADARWVAKLAFSLLLPCLIKKCDLKAAAAGISLETAGRQARHRFFGEAATQYRCHRIFLAHHADDQAETVLMQLCRGSAGAAGIAPETALRLSGRRSPLTLLRPLLPLPKTTLLEAARQAGWSFREDASNAVPDVVRNRLRLEVLPLLDAIFQRPVAPALARAATWTAAVRQGLEEAAAPWWGEEKLRLASLKPLTPVLQDTILAGWLKARGVPDVSAALIAKAVAMLDPATGPARWNAPGNTFLRRRAGWLWVEGVPACGPGTG